MVKFMLTGELVEWIWLAGMTSEFYESFASIFFFFPFVAATVGKVSWVSLLACVYEKVCRTSTRGRGAISSRTIKHTKKTRHFAKKKA